MSRGDRLFRSQLLATLLAGLVTIVLVVVVAPSESGARVRSADDATPAKEAGELAPGSSKGVVIGAPETQSEHGPVAAWVQRENARPGTSAWRIEGEQHRGDLEGYADKVSAVQGETVNLYVSTVAPTWHVDAYRMGYYGGAGGRLVWHSADQPGEVQAPSTLDPVTHMVEAPWTPSMRLTIDRTWPPGTYLLKLIGSANQQQYIPLTIRDDASTAAYVIQNSVTTWQAYNLWGGYSLYFGKTGKGEDFAHRSRVVSFDRPYYYGDGSGEFLNNELGLVSLAESLGLDVTYWTDVDLHEHPERLLRHRALFSLGHDEYWSTSMRNGAEAARDHGVNLAFMGANAVYRHIRFEPSQLGVDRHEIDYKVAREDPLDQVDPLEVTSQWREPPVPRPESQLIGDLYECNPVKADMLVTDPEAWVYAGTGLTKNEHLKDVVGQEYDRYTPGHGAPANVALFAHSPLRCGGKASYADMTYYSAPSGGGVFATGTNWWIGKLGGPCPDDPCVGYALTQITTNVLAVFGQGPAGLTHPSVATAVVAPPDTGGGPTPTRSFTTHRPSTTSVSHAPSTTHVERHPGATEPPTTEPARTTRTTRPPRRTTTTRGQQPT
ncbi:MAG TPA: N,N-dimethylformamidase beta subunit family domain-containing protein [Acidimicrobiales bacterium]|nr:N,N-dimethylformamidase beta subunit family domain-containing protein [Acidimicrobiales bacterium]